MKKLLIFVLFIIGCSEDHVIKKKICNPFRMTISDALPVQFWVNGVETYNQKEVCGITPVCFCQPFNCDDEIRIQVQDVPGEQKTLKILDSTSTELASMSINEVSTGVYEVSFTPSSLSICDENIRLEISSVARWNNGNGLGFTQSSSVTYGNGLFVAVSDQVGIGINRVATSTDGINWTLRAAIDAIWEKVAYGDGLFVAVGASGAVMTSPDGITWTSRTSPEANSWNGVVYGDGLWAAVSFDGSNRVMTSPDGITWTSRTCPSQSWIDITYGNDIFVAVGQSGSSNRVMTSVDGITWTNRVSAADNSWRAVTYGNGLFVAVSNSGSGNRVMTSTDGIGWTIRSSAANNLWEGIAFGNDYFVAVSLDGASRSMFSADGITWTSLATATSTLWTDITYGDGRFVTIYGISNYVSQLEDAIEATSDCLDIKTSHDCTTLIRYDNAKDFAGLEYSSFSPTAEFYLRIPAIFFHERNTEEEESFEESTENIVRLRNEIKLKKLLEVGFMPDYMHRKLLLILAHDTVEIDGESWVKRDPYEKEEPSNKRYPLKKASVLLTQKDYIKRNIL